MASIHPITDDDLEAVCMFWRAKFASPLDQQTWVSAFRRPWHPSKPNNGFLLRDGDTIVGALGALYSLQRISGVEEAFCNMTNWYIGEEHRGQSLPLLYRLIRQPGFHFTNLSASPGVAKILPAVGFSALAPALLAVPNIALPRVLTSQTKVLDRPEEFLNLLEADRQKIAEDHRDCPKIRQLAVGASGTGYCHIVFSLGICRNLPCAVVHDIGNPTILKRYWGAIAAYFLYRLHVPVTRFDTRSLAGVRLPWGIALGNNTTEFFLSRSLRDEVVRPLYTEAMAFNQQGF